MDTKGIKMVKNSNITDILTHQVMIFFLYFSVFFL